ncbi:oligopeptide/dipeptide ABC transporter ATP-binding protein [Kibdelosporangium banguiense]|uniref:Oligopeptide/dipeptide ABC transporter ATP-binding protein n=1 Tax=Kibdelosporangium banguiense TaxID=1365924 RepID=A0ABS4TXS0_9PSEU|nr:ABC transporter ATP-binding protein [Kibdelosporangium banguiense]MBP2329200.1 oligopeptide/dipeptide ABC transporter ATP-binding protein [Kibdelosporangium banguiense]
MTEPLLVFDRLGVDLPVGVESKPVIHDVSLTIAAGEAVGLVGESGSGKSMTARAVLRLLPAGARVRGEIRFDGQPVQAMTPQVLRRYRARDVAMVFQDPRAHINPVRTVGDFLCEGLVTTRGVKPREAERTVTGLLREVGIRDPERRLCQHPHELSGGLLQRVMIAAALAAEPRLILADEPTTALDVTTQEEVVAILDELRRERGLAMLFITHDLELAAAICDRTAVMYAGSIVEDARSALLHTESMHPYTTALLASRPDVARRGERLRTIVGRPLSAFEVPDGCAFSSRCPHVVDQCRVETPRLRTVETGRVACHVAGQLDRKEVADV